MPQYETPSFFLIGFPSGPLGTNTYVLICKQTKKAAIIDAAPDSFLKVTRALTQYEATIADLILTHSHGDHIADAKKFIDHYRINVRIHSEDVANLQNPGSDRIPTWMQIDGVEPSNFLDDQERLTIGGTNWQIIHTPGHSPGSICLYCEQEKVVLSGDTLFKGSMGRLDLPTGEPQRMWVSLKKLAKLPPETRVFPGHGGPTTIGQEQWLPDAENYFGL